MSEQDVKGPYVYQPFGWASHPERMGTGRLFGVAGLHHQATITGLTKEEAQRVLAVLSQQTTDAEAPNER